MTDKQIRFCEEYLIDLNATQSAIRAGYSEKTAYSIGQENLNKPEIMVFLKKAQQKLSERNNITADMVIQELAKIGFSDISQYFDGDEKQRDITTLENKLTAAVSSLKVTTAQGKDWSSTTKEFKLHDKVKALEDLGKHLGVFEKDNKQKKESSLITFNKIVTNNVRDRDQDNSAAG